MKNAIGGFLLLVWYVTSPIYFIYLTFFDGYHYNWWNWLIALPVNGFLSTIWPIHLLILRPLFG